MALLQLLFVFALLLFPLGELVRVDLQSSAAITANEIGVGTLFIYFIFYGLFIKKLVLDELIKPLLIFISIAILSLALHISQLAPNELLVAFLYLLRWMAYASIFFVVKSFNKSFKEKVVTFLVVIGSVILFGGFLQYFLYPNLRNLYYLGWDEHLYRLFSSLLDPNFTAVFLVLYSLFLLGLLIERFRAKKKSSIVIFLILEILTIIAIFLTYSRSGILMFLVSFVSFLILQKSILGYILNKKIFSIIFFVAILLAFIFLSPKAFQTEGTNLLRVASAEARITSAQNALQIFLKNPALGVGFNAYRYAQKRYGFIDEKGFESSHSGAGTDNSYLFVLATTGVIGFVAYSYVWFFTLKKAFIKLKKKDKHTQMLAIVFLSSAFGLFVDTVFINAIFYVFIMEWMWILLGLMD